MNVLASAGVLVVAYVLGAVPFSYLVARGFGVPDVRDVGSGNVGASNVMRSAGVVAGLLALALDILKGAAAVLLAQLSGVGDHLPPLAAAAAAAGHMFPVWLGLRGGKGVATGAGAFFPLAPLATLVAVAVFGAAVGLSRYVSLGSIAAALALPLAALALGYHGWVVGCAGALAALIVLRHRGNIGRMLRGTEHRLGAKRP